MDKTTRIYEVKQNILDEKGVTVIGCRPRLIEATSTAAAFGHVANELLQKPEIASGKRIAELVGGGVKVESANQ